MIGIVPARGGSKGLRNKNLLTIDGIPLVINAANALNEYCEKVLVCTEDAQIASVARLHGYEVLGRPADLAADDVPLDRVMTWVSNQIPLPFVMHQPTVYSPGLSYLSSFMAKAEGGGWKVAVAPTRHITWNSSFDEPGRNQRQEMEYWPAREIGLRYYGSAWMAYYPVPVQVDDHAPIFDIDTPYDLDAARRASMRKGRVTMRCAYSRDIGSGHQRRLEAIADEIQHLDVNMMNWGEAFTDDYASVIVNDTLDTTEHTMLRMKQAGAKVITLEDLGPGTRHADVVINALYDKSHARYAVLRPEFRNLPGPKIKDKIENILITFGGTDPSHYTEAFLEWDWESPLAEKLRLTVVAPPGRIIEKRPALGTALATNPNMAEQMAWADLVITSAGRTIFEAGAVGTPVLCVAHNLREARHAHLGPASGNIFMGIGLDMEVVERNIRLLGDPRLRAEMSEAGRNLTDGRGAERIARIVEDLL